MKYIPNSVSSTVARQVLKTQKHSPALLFAAGITGMIGAGILACRATLQVENLVFEHEKGLVDIREGARENEQTSLERKAQIKLALDLGKLYAPAVGLAAVSVFSLASSHNILSKRNAALAAAYGTMEKAYSDYRDRVREAYGEEREAELYRDVQVCDITDEKTGKVKKVKRAQLGGSPYSKLFDSTNRNWVHTAELNWLFLKLQQNVLNDKLQSQGHLFLNEVYDELGMDRTAAGAVVGWLRSGHGDGYVDFGLFEDQMSERVYDFMVGNEDSVWVDFNVDGEIYRQI